MKTKICRRWLTCGLFRGMAYQSTAKIFVCQMILLVLTVFLTETAADTADKSLISARRQPRHLLVLNKLSYHCITRFWLPNVKIFYVLCYRFLSNWINCHNRATNRVVLMFHAVRGGSMGLSHPRKLAKVALSAMIFLQFGKQHSRWKAILSCIALSLQCCEAHFQSLAVAKPLWDLTTKYYWNRPP